MNAIPSTISDFLLYRVERLRLIQDELPLLRDPPARNDASAHALASSLLEFYSYTGNLDYLQETIATYRELLDGPLDDHTARVAALNGLSTALYHCWEHSARLAGLGEAALLSRQALNLCRELDVNPLGSILGLLRILTAAQNPTLTQNHVDLQEDGDALLLEAHTLDLDFPHANALFSMISAEFLLIKSRISGAADIDAKLDAARDLCLKGLELPEIIRFPELWRLLLVSGRVAYERFLRSGATYTNPETLMYTRCAMELVDSPTIPGYWMSRQRHAMQLTRLSLSKDDADTLEQALHIARVAISACPLYAPYRKLAMMTIQAGLRTKADRYTSVECMTEGIALLRGELSMDIWASDENTLLDLGRWLTSRWDFSGDPSDIDESIDIFQNLLTISRNTGTIAMIHFHLATALLDRYRYQLTTSDAHALNSLSDVERALHHNRIALDLFLGANLSNADYISATRNNLAEAILDWVLATGDLRRVSEGLLLAREAIAWSASKPGYTLGSSSLAVVHCLLRIRLEKVPTSRRQDLAEIIRVHDSALELLPRGHPRRAHAIHEIALTHLVAYAVMDQNTAEHLASAREAFARAASDSSAVAYHRLSNAIEWIAKAQSLAPEADFVEEFLATVDILSQVAIVGMTSVARLAALRRCRGLAMNGALHALSRDMPHAALSILEQGRTVFWQRTLQLRTSFDNLPPALCSRLQLVSAELDNERGLATQRRLHLGMEFDDLLRQARQCPGEQHFLSALPAEQLAKVAADGPVVIFIAGEATSEAIVIPSDKHSPERVPLNVNSERVSEWVRLIHVTNVAVRTRLADDRKLVKMPKRELDHISYDGILAEIWTVMVLPVIEKLGLSTSSSARTRMWLCPVGVLAFLPFHAAGIHTGPSSICISDFVVCSYTPTLTALINARLWMGRMPSSTGPSLVVVAAPEAPQLPALPNVLAEVQQIGDIAGAHQLIQCAMGNAEAVDKVLAALPQASVLHMACHGQQNPNNALESGFCIGDDMLTIADIMHLKLPAARLAMLSACETAKGDAGQPDEAIHLAAAMMFAGFPSVVGTMWSMTDEDGPEVAKIVYAELFRNGVFKPEAAPYALDMAVRQMRDAGVHPSRWATYIHTGV